MAGSGNFVIAWGDGRDGESDVYFQRYNAFGASQGNNQRATDGVGSTRQSSPAIAVDGSGNLVIAWVKLREVNSYSTDDFFQRYDSLDGRRGNSQKVNDDSELGGQIPTIAMDSGGNFVIVWGDLRDENKDVYFQRYDASGVKQGNNQKTWELGVKVIQPSPWMAAAIL